MVSYQEGKREISPTGKFLNLFTRSTLLRDLLSNRYSQIGFVLLLGYIVLAFIGPLLAPYNPSATTFGLNLSPSSKHLLGTTAYGQDVMSQILAGAGPTLGIGLAVGFVGTLISIVVGISAGLSANSWIDSILSGLTYLFLLIPGIMFILLIGTYFLGAGIYLGYFSLFFSLTITGWAWGARTLRSQTMSIAKKEYILSSRLIGESRTSIIFRQIVRGNFSLMVSNFFFTSIYGLLGLTWIEFFGLGNETSINWGTMLYWSISNEAYLTGYWWWYIPVSVLIAGLAFAFSLLNFGIDQVTNAKLRTQVSEKRRRGTLSRNVLKAEPKDGVVK